MVNHFVDAIPATTRCGEYSGELAFAISSNLRVTCPTCRSLLSDREWDEQWYPRGDDE